MPTRTASPRRLVPIAEGASHARVHVDTIRRYIRTGQITGYRFGPRLIKVDLDELDAMARPIPAAGVR